MAKTSTTRQKKPRLKAADFPPPRQLSQDQVLDICEALRISDRHALQIKTFLDDLVDHINDWMSQDETTNRKRDHASIVSARKQITLAQDKLKGLGIDGRLAIRSATARLADIVSGDWLRHHFPGDAPSRPNSLRRHPRSTREYGDSSDEAYSNYRFVRQRAPKTLQALLRDLDAVLASALTTLASDPRARGGQQPLTYRHNVLVNLCEIWSRIGETVVVTSSSKFAAFCDYTVGAIGWPTDGLDAAIPDAVSYWRNLR